jgi:glucose/arabinose dehydrogenase
MARVSDTMRDLGHRRAEGRRWDPARLAALPILLATALFLGGCASDPPPGGGNGDDPPAPDDPAPVGPPPPTPNPPEPGPPVTIVEEVIATGLEVPWEVVFTPEGRTFLTERDSGRLLERDPDGDWDLVHRFTDVDPEGEGGLMGLAVSPDWASDGALYVYYTGPDDNRIVRLVPGDEDAPELILGGIPKGVRHNGGRIAFGPDGMLYAGTGDANASNHSALLDSLAGKILRMTPEGEVPDDNPFEDSYVYALGLRNVQGLAWDWAHRLWVTDFGPQIDDEVNLIEAGGDYGWPEVTGFAGEADTIDPVIVRQPAEASWSGLFIQQDGAIPQWNGSMFAASLRGRRLWRFSSEPGDFVDDDAYAESLYEDRYGRIRTVTQAPDGSLWLLTSNRDGRLFEGPAPEDDRIIRLSAGE